MMSKMRTNFSRVVAAAAFGAMVISPALADEALVGRWTGTVGRVAVTVTIETAQGGTLTGTIVSSVASTTISNRPRDATNANGTYQGNAVTIDGAGGLWRMQLQGNQLRGRWYDTTGQARAR